MVFYFLASFHFHIESLVISHIVNDQAHAIVIPNLANQVDAVEIVDISRQSLTDNILNPN